jgi:hypothetical protein
MYMENGVEMATVFGDGSGQTDSFFGENHDGRQTPAHR